MTAIMGHAGVISVAIAAVIGIAAIVGSTPVIDGRAAIIIVIIVPAVLGRGNGQTGATDTGKRGGRRGASAVIIVPSAGAEVGRIAGAGLRRNVLVWRLRPRVSQGRANGGQRQGRTGHPS